MVNVFKVSKSCKCADRISIILYVIQQGSPSPSLPPTLSLPLSLSVAKQLAYLYPRFYNCSVPATFSGDLPQLSRLCEGTKAVLTSDKWAEPLLSVRGEKFVSFAKSERFVDGKMLLMC